MSTNEIDVVRYIDRVSRSLTSIEGFARIFLIGLTAVILLFAVAVGVQAYGHGGIKVFLLALGTGLVVFIAAAAVGGLLGFLFGIPRSLQGNTLAPQGEPKPKPATSTEQTRTPVNVARAFMNNTSLEEISDWLTKIIIGLGLVQFQLLIDYLYRCALYAASFVGAQPIPAGDLSKLAYDPKLASPFFFALIVAALIVGCLFTYLETRTRLMLLFVDAEGASTNLSEDRRKAEEAGERPVSVSQPQAAPNLESKRQPPSPIAVAPTVDDIAVTKVPLADLQNPKEVIGWASAQARTGNFAEAERVLLEALQANPNDNAIRERIVEVRRLNKNPLGALKMIVEIADRTVDQKKRYELLRSSLYEALYLPEPDGFNEALDISQKLLEMPQAQRNATIYLWRACALGQKYKWLKEKGATPDQSDMKDIWEAAYTAVKKAVEFAPNYDASERELLRSLYEGRLDGEDDLKVFKSDPFDKAIYQGKP